MLAEGPSNYESWGIRREAIALHVATQSMIGGVAGGASNAINSGVGVVLGNQGQQLGKTFGEAEAEKKGLKGQEKSDFINSYQQFFATLGGGLGGLALSGMSGQGGVDAFAGLLTGSKAAETVDVYNRQLHPDEAKIIRENAAAYAKKNKISVEQAESILAAQALKQVDSAWDARIKSDATASTFLSEIAKTTMEKMLAAEIM